MNSNSYKFGSVQQKLITSAEFNDEAKALVMVKFSHFASEDGKMSLEGFKSFFDAHPGLIADVERAHQYFRAFDDRFHGHLLYNQFLTGLAAFDPNTAHGRDLGDIRSRYIFRFYCSQHSARGVMGEADFRQLAKDIVKIKDPSIAGEELNKKAGPYFQHFELELNVNKFVSKVGSLQLRGTSSLFRATCPVVKYLKEHQYRPIKQEDHEMDVTECGAIGEAGTQTDVDFRISHSAIYVTNSGCVLEKLAEVTNPAMVESELPVPVTQNTASMLKQAPDACQDREKAVNHAVDFLRGLDYFFRPYELKTKAATAIGDNAMENQDGESDLQQAVHRKAALDWHEVKKPKLATCLIKLCQYVHPILAAEQRCLELKQPIYILGDVHGNFEDLHEFERLLWPMGPEHCIADILFLGDYVDRGAYGMEVVAYIFALKILAPTKVYLLRGNHELRDQQTAFTFKKECLEKLGNVHGDKVWQAINSCFDCMPMAAVIDEKIFCVHGGIPHPRFLDSLPDEVPKEDLVSIINSVCQCPAKEFMWESVPWELLWNDPVWDGDDNASKFDQYGFRRNPKRGTGHEFSSAALEAFLDRFGLSHIIRAHQVQATGFQIRYHAKCLTVFSSSRYSGLENEAAVVIVNGGAIKLIRLSLRTAHPASTAKENEQQDDPISEGLSRKKIGVFAKR